jgi:hypothetical protein
MESITANHNIRHYVLLLLTVGCVVLVFSRSSIPQDPAYHSFADQREFFGIANFLNVVTNLPFVAIGLMGIMFSIRQKRIQSLPALVMLFIGVISIGIGSGWYHYHPTNTTLVCDRIPMTITFMAYFSITVSRQIDQRYGNWILIPLIALGVLSVLYWYIGELSGRGDLRLYAFVQFYPMLAIPLIMFLYPARKGIRLTIVSIILVYAIAKLAEHEDETIYSFHHLISGHSVKHLFASGAVLLMLLTLKE